jgi:RimJ/RimL family protein N-acetyltransferase
MRSRQFGGREQTFRARSPETPTPGCGHDTWTGHQRRCTHSDPAVARGRHPADGRRGVRGQEGAKRWYAEELGRGDGPSNEFRQFAVETVSGEWIGFTGFYAEPDGDAGGYFTIAEPFRGQGYGTELVRCVLEVMFLDCAAARCTIDYHDWNEVAARIYAKFGFDETQRIRIPKDNLTDEDRAMAPDRPVHAVVITLTREKFLGSRAE